MNTTMKTELLSKTLVATLLDGAKSMPADMFRALFSGAVVASLVGQLPEDYWRDFMKVEPCGKPGCDCHVFQEKLCAVLDEARSEYNKVMKAREDC